MSPLPKPRSLTRTPVLIAGAASISVWAPIIFFVPGVEERLAYQAAKWGPRWTRGFAKVSPAVQRGHARVEPHVQKGVQKVEPPLKRAALAVDRKMKRVFVNFPKN